MLKFVFSPLISIKKIVNAFNAHLILDTVTSSLTLCASTQAHHGKWEDPAREGKKASNLHSVAQFIQ